MPIRPENKDRYPKNWSSEIVPAIRDRSGNRCECLGECGIRHETALNMRCRARNGETGYWLDGQWIPLPLPQPGEEFVKIILTVAHLNHTPEDCDPANLRHFCQRCHNRYDAPTRAAGIQARRRAQRASGDLFQCEETT